MKKPKLNNWTVLHTRFERTLRERTLLPQGSRLLLAVSGGQDSLCLSKLVLDLREKWQWEIGIAHCDHGWVTDGGISAHVAKIAENFQLPFYLKIAPDKLPETEAAAREWRYQALIAVAQEQEFGYILTGHTQSDRAETFLYNLLRGAGTAGISSLSWQRHLTPQIKLIRPLLNISRPETLDFCQQFDLPIWEDVANSKIHYARNRIRGELIPYLQTHFNPQVEKHLAQTAEILRGDLEYLESRADEIFLQTITPDGKGLNRIILRRISVGLQRRVIVKFLSQNLPKTPNFEQVEEVRALIWAANKTGTSSLPGSLMLQVSGNLIKVGLI